MTFDKSKVASPSPNGADTVVEPLSPSKAPSKVEAFVAAWNDLTTPPIGRCREITARRRTAITARLRERSLEDWQEVFRRIEASAFCRGQNARGWHADIDFVLQPDTAAKVLEGKYDDRTPQAASGGCGHTPPCRTLTEHRDRSLAEMRAEEAEVAHAS